MSASDGVDVKIHGLDGLPLQNTPIQNDTMSDHGGFSTAKVAVKGRNAKNKGKKGVNSSNVVQEGQLDKTEASIMGTNDSSIVSKRSVERIYYAEPHMFRHFVKKPKRRAPLINRGYWLRMRAISDTVKSFLREETSKKKVVLNLGCGYDPMPFEMLAREEVLCRDTIFIDVDYPYLMQKKCELLEQTAEISKLLAVFPPIPGDEVLLRSEHYAALGCDLMDLPRLEHLLGKMISIKDCTFLLVAEVSVTYMDSDGADRLIAWSAKLGAARFCLLEQCLPWGHQHPFAQTMLKHFNKLGTTLKSLKNYSTIGDQQRRFRDRGWQEVTARSLWEFWSDDNILSVAERTWLNKVEPFDEWEEFALYAAHYFLLVAKVTASPSIKIELAGDAKTIAPKVPHESPSPTRPSSKIAQGDEGLPQRNYGGVYQHAPNVLCHHGGYGDQTRQNSTDVYVRGNTTATAVELPPTSIEARMCHTITPISRDHGVLMVGGRTGPDHALSECWLRQNGKWQMVEPLPKPLYRHSAALVEVPKGGEGVLVFGGRSKGGVASNEWFLWQDGPGWCTLPFHGPQLHPRFGSNMVGTPQSRCDGILLGGMTEDGKIVREVIAFHLDYTGRPAVVGQACSGSCHDYICRIGASLVPTSEGMVLIGGITCGTFSPEKNTTIERIELRETLIKTTTSEFRRDPATPIPLLIGHTAIWDGETIIVLGGGAVCFSFGAYSNKAVLSIDSLGRATAPSWKRLDVRSLPAAQGQTHKDLNTLGCNLPATCGDKICAPSTGVTRLSKIETQSFRTQIAKSVPAVLESCGQGSCVEKWKPEYLKEQVGAERVVTVHDSTSSHMDFRVKNFEYIKKPFGDFIDDIRDGKQQYLRSLSSTNALETADFWRDYPSLAADFHIPQALAAVINEEWTASKARYHSSVLRVSGPVSMWLHYDVMANILCQVHGSKTLVLFPPSDVAKLGIAAGQSSSSINVFDADTFKTAPLNEARRYETVLEPGDILFIPPLWAHAAAPTGGVSIAVNVFFRDLDAGYASGRDTYGNRDLQAYEEGRKDVAKVVNRFKGLPEGIRGFYLQRLAQELADLALN